MIACAPRSVPVRDCSGARQSGGHEESLLGLPPLAGRATQRAAQWRAQTKHHAETQAAPHAEAGQCRTQSGFRPSLATKHT